MESLKNGVVSFFSQPWGVAGALCIMVGATAFNSRRLKGRISKTAAGTASLSNLLNAFNLVGGACLLVNAWIRDEAVWIVLEVYFVAIALKGLSQARRAAQNAQAPEGAP